MSGDTPPQVTFSMLRLMVRLPTDGVYFLLRAVMANRLCGPIPPMVIRARVSFEAQAFSPTMFLEDGQVDSETWEVCWFGHPRSLPSFPGPRSSDE